jgi:hypothetical protein
VDLAGNEIGSILVTADADITPVEAKLARMERSLGDAAARIDRTYSRVGSQAFTGLDQATARILQRVPLVGGVLAQVERRASSLRQSFFTAGQASETAIVSARKQVEQLGMSIVGLESKLASLRAKASLITSDFAGGTQRLVDDLQRRTGQSFSSDFLRNYNNTAGAKERDALILGATGGISQELANEVDRAAAKFGNMERSATRALGNTKVQIADTEKELASLKGAASTAEQGLAGLASAGGGLVAMLGEVSGPLLLVVAALAAVAAASVGVVYGAYQLASSAAEVGAKYKDLSMETGYTAHELNALDVAASQVGVSFNQIGAGLGIFEKKLEAGAEKSSKLSRVLKDANVDVRDNQKALEGMFTVLSKLPDGTTKTALAMEAFGRGGKAMLAIIAQAHGDLPTFIKHLEDLGAVLSDKDAAAAQEFEAKQKLLAAQFDVMKVKVGEEVMPIFEALFDNLSKWLSQNGDDFRTWGQIVGGVALAVIEKAHEVAVAWRAALSVIQAVSGYASGDGRTSEERAASGGKFTAPYAMRERAAQDYYARGNAGVGSALARGLAQPPSPFMLGLMQADAAVKAATKKAQDDYAKHVSGLMGEKSGGGRKGRKAGNEMADAALESAQIDLREAESVYQQGNQIAKRFLDQNLTDYESYVSTLKQLEDERYKAVRAGFKAEEAAAAGLDGAKRDVKLKDIRQREQAAEREHQDKLSQYTAEGEQHRYDIQQKFAQSAVSLLEEAQRAQDAELQLQIEAGTTTHVAAMRARFTALGAVAEAQGKVLEGALTHAMGGAGEVSALSGPDLDLAEMISQAVNDAVNATNSEGMQDAFKTILANASNPEAAQEAIDQIKAFFLQRKQAFAQFNKDEQTAVADDLSTLQNYRKSLAEITDATAEDQRSAQEALLKVMEASGKNKQALWQKQYQFDLEGEQLQQERKLRELQLERETTEATEQDGVKKLEKLKALDDEMEAVRQSSNVRQLALLDDLIAKQNDRLKQMADKAISLIDGALQTLRTKGWKAMFQQIGQDFLNMIIKMEENLLESKLMTLLRQLTNTPLPGSATGTTQQPRQQSGVQSALGPFGLFGAMISRLFNLGGNNNSQKADASAVSSAGHAATTAINDGWKNSVAQIGKTGEAQSKTLMSVGQSIVSTMLSIAAVLAAGAAQGSFWKGLLAAAGIGFISGLTNGLFKPHDSSGGTMADDPTGINPDTSSGYAASGGIFGARPGGRFIRVAEGGYDEVVLTTDPAQRGRMRQLLAAYLGMTGLSGGSFAAGGFASGYTPPSYASRSSFGGGVSVGAVQVFVRADEDTSAGRGRARKTGRQIGRAARAQLLQFQPA